MGQKNSKDEILYQQVTVGNVEAIKALCTQGARLEWIDKEGKTPLIVASMDYRLYQVAKTLIELGANLNAYRPGRHAGTPLHHAARRDLDETVNLLLSHGANPFVRNDDCQTPLDVARAKGHNKVVRAIEASICYFSGEMREILVAPGILEPLVPQSLSRKRSKKSWVVVVPFNLPKSGTPPKLELAVYLSPQDPKPHTVIALWKCNIAEPKFQESDPVLKISDQSTGAHHKFLSAIEGNKQQLAQLYMACKGHPKVIPSSEPHCAGTNPSLAEASNQRESSSSTTISNQASIATDTNGWGDSEVNTYVTTQTDWAPPPPSNTSFNGWAYEPTKTEYNGWAVPGPSSTSGPGPSQSISDRCSGWVDEPTKTEHNGWAIPGPSPTSEPSPSQSISDRCSGWVVDSPTEEYNRWAVPGPSNTPRPEPVLDPNFPTPSAPPIPGDILDHGSFHYPEVDLSPVDYSAQSTQSNEGKGKADASDESCVICWEAKIEAACIPCGHMAGCMSCLTEIKSKKGFCPVCRAKIDQVVKLYAV